MELPFTVVFEPPSRSELQALLRMRGHWVAGLIVALTIGTIYLLANVARADAGSPVEAVSLTLTSQPSGATVWVDGRQRGTTPLVLAVEPGAHALLLKAPRMLERQYSVDVGADGAALNAVLWRTQPEVMHLRPALPGAALADARLLDDGELGLSVWLPPGHQLEAWRLEPRSGELVRVAQDVTGSRLVFAADSHHVAYLGPEVGPVPRDRGTYFSDSGQAIIAWIADADRAASGSPGAGWRAPLEAAEQLVDLAWSPRADRLLVISTQQLPGGARRSRGWFVDSDGQHASEVAFNIPSDVVPGTARWSPDGVHVAFVAHAAQVNALCLVGLDGTFRYVADLDVSANMPMPFPVFSWSPDGQRMLFVAPHQHLPGAPFDWLQPDAQHAIYRATIDQPLPTALSDTQADQVTWREDGQILGLARTAADAPLSVRLLNGSGVSGQELLTLPVKPGAEYAAAWDLGRGRLLLAGRSSTAYPDFWLVRLAEDLP